MKSRENINIMVKIRNAQHSGQWITGMMYKLYKKVKVNTAGQALSNDDKLKGQN